MSEPNGYPTIADAKALATKYRRRGVIVLHFGGGRFGTASYGMTRADCAAMKDVSEQIHAAIGDGGLTVPDGEDAGDSAGYGGADGGAIAELVRLRQRVAQLEAVLSSRESGETTQEVPA